MAQFTHIKEKDNEESHNHQFLEETQHLNERQNFIPLNF